jgi:hypothetical protein
MSDAEATAWLQQFIHWEQFPPRPPNNNNNGEDGCGFAGSDATATEAGGPARQQQQQQQQQQQHPNHKGTARESNSTADIPTRIQWRQCLAESVGPAMGACADATLRRAALMHALLLELGPNGSGFLFNNNNNNNNNVLPDVPSRRGSNGDDADQVDADATSSSMGHFESSAASTVSVWEYLLLLHSRRHGGSPSSSSSSAVATSAEWDWLRGHSLQEWRREWEACCGADDEYEDDNRNSSSSLPTLGGRPRRHRVAWMHGWPDRLRLHYERLDELRTNGGVPNRPDDNAHNAHPSTAAAASSKRRRLDFLLDGSGTKNDPADDADSVVDDRWIVALLYLVCHWSVVGTTMPAEGGDDRNADETATDTGAATSSSSSSKRPFHDRPWEDAFDHIVVRLFANHCPEEFRSVRPGAGAGPPPSHHNSSNWGGAANNGASASWISELRVVSDWYLLDHWKCLRQIRQRHLDENHAPSWTVENWVRGRYGGNAG